MRIAVIGAGNVGGRLGARWATNGHEVTFGVRDPSAATTPAGARATTVGEAVRDAEVVVLAVPWPAVPDALAAAGDLSGRVLIDATNRIGTAKPGETASGGEEVARLAAGARVVKAFNTIGAENFSDLDYGAARPAGFFCGDDAEAKAVVSGLAEEIGFDPVDAGPLANAALLESLTLLWIRLTPALGRRFAFAVLHRA